MPDWGVTRDPGVTRVVESDRHDGVVGFEVESERGRDVRRELANTIVSSGWGLLELRPMRMSLEDIFLSLTTEEAADAGAGGRRQGGRMSNILAIAQKELRSYFASPIGYVLIGFWALLFGWFYINILAYFVRQSMQMGQFQQGRRR